MNGHAASADNVVDRAVAALRATTCDDRPPPALLDRTVAAVDAAAHAPRPRMAVRFGRPLAAIAAATSMAAAVAVMVAVATSFGGGGEVFAAMLDRIREVKSVRYRLAAPDDRAHVVIQTADGRYLAERRDGTIVFIGRDDGGIRLDTASKTALAFTPEEKAQHLPHVDLLRDMAAVERGERIAGRRVGSVAAVGYRVVQVGDDADGPRRGLFAGMRVYVDPATSLPVRAERDVSRVVDGVRRDGTVVMTDFEWDPAVDPALLAIDPPAGYRVVTQAWSPCATPQERIAAGLRFYASQMQGRLPDGIDDAGIESMHAELLRKLPEQDRAKLRNDDATKWEKFAAFTKQRWPLLPSTTGLLEVGADKVHYLGKGMQAGDGSKMVAWWKADRPGRVIAIYDDFSWKEIAEPAAAE